MTPHISDAIARIQYGTDKTHFSPAVVDGRTYATDGRVFLVATTPDAEPAAVTSEQADIIGRIDRMTDRDGHGQRFELAPFLASLRAIAETVACDRCAGTGRVQCTDCKGTGRVEHECNCTFCHVSASVACDCGDGWHWCPRTEPDCQADVPQRWHRVELRLNGAPVDATMLLRALPWTDGAVRYVAPDSADFPHLFFGDGWTVGVMGIREASDGAPAVTL